ncbi:hypothetical protein HWB76_gp086 [Streptomyces phage Blueeyedbeauty]|uniref:Uncharacterized protein n=1 Tax=Streptomyces phage Blueeyedbeauty TaxID=2250336 RepID=A0A345L213_9CAUD|nr:hypothetical protein HWB76_gp086 [Streptomyces phage Blueeyedbeauty]AXH49315.1 hypothetical protein SEA_BLUEEYEDBEAUTY_207 [Streptomyces phage Blueeyedbeauty]
MITVQQVKDAVEDTFEGYESEFYGEIRYAGKNGMELNGLGTAYSVDYEGGGEGQGENMWVVFRIGDQLFRKYGYYSSWDGSDWDGDLEEVEPYEVTVVRYREVKR